MERMELTRDQQPDDPTRPADGLPAVEEHGRAVTTTPTAAAWYRQAQRAVDCRRATGALELAVTADPAFALAIADLSALRGTSTPDHRGGQINWERHHIEVVRAASAGNVTARPTCCGNTWLLSAATHSPPASPPSSDRRRRE